jgi:hypothetical protein
VDVNLLADGEESSMEEVDAESIVMASLKFLGATTTKRMLAGADLRLQVSILLDRNSKRNRTRKQLSSPELWKMKFTMFRNLTRCMLHRAEMKKCGVSGGHSKCLRSNSERLLSCVLTQLCMMNVCKHSHAMPKRS